MSDKLLEIIYFQGLLEKRRKQVDDFTAFRERKRRELEKKQEAYSECKLCNVRFTDYNKLCHVIFMYCCKRWIRSL